MQIPPTSLESAIGADTADGADGATSIQARVTALYRTERDRLLGHAYGVTRDFHGACDIVQETFLRASREERILRGDFRVRAWLLRVCGNLALNWVRDCARREARESGQPVWRGNYESKGSSSRKSTARREPSSPDAAEEVLRRQMGRELLEAMDAIPAAYRRVLLLRYAEGMSCSEIAEWLDTPAGTVMSWIHRARLVLRRRLGR